jgi:hypothetical protein
MALASTGKTMRWDSPRALQKPTSAPQNLATSFWPFSHEISHYLTGGVNGTNTTSRLNKGIINLELTGKTALISGSTKGIGFAIASHQRCRLGRGWRRRFIMFLTLRLSPK